MIGISWASSNAPMRVKCIHRCLRAFSCRFPAARSSIVAMTLLVRSTLSAAYADPYKLQRGQGRHNTGAMLRKPVQEAFAAAARTGGGVTSGDHDEREGEALQDDAERVRRHRIAEDDDPA